MRKNVTNPAVDEPRPGIADGFSMLELLIVVAIIAIVSSLALLSFQNSNRDLKTSGAIRTLSVYLEKARLDSLRRHGGASININSATTYTVNMDFDGSGTTSSRTITLPANTTLTYTLPPATASTDPSTTPTTISYDWRGRSTNAVSLILTDSTSGVARNVVVGSSGDISTDTSVTGPVSTPTPQTSVATTSGIKTMH
jgi:prepilin-type N-terminal cleavage/methylation domain-containing protein